MRMRRQNACVVDPALIEAWRREEAEPFTGWDFGHIASRSRPQKPPWSFKSVARAALRQADRALDLGTGGGEVLAALHDAFPRVMVATEAHPPNVAVAHRRLAPLGATLVAYGVEPGKVPVSRVQDTAPCLPFRDGSFDLILDRHEAYDAPELARVLASGGVFLTQQLDGRSHAELLQRFGVAPQWPGVTQDNLVVELREAGLTIEDARSSWGTLAFSDIGALVYYLKAVPWLVPGFSVARFEAVLLQLHEELEAAGELRVAEGAFLIRARKR